MRRRRADKRQVTPDPKFKNIIITIASEDPAHFVLPNGGYKIQAHITEIL